MHPASARKCTRRVIHFGKYELLSRINIGGMAEIVKARDTGSPDGRLVAIKRILPHLCSEPHYKAMFMDEARVLAQLDHPSVIRAYEYGEIDDTPFMALEYVRGHDAREVLHYCLNHGQPMPLGLACYVIARVCEGLQHAHDQTDAHGQSLGIVHRDVSLQNILLGYDGDVKLIDFGIAVSAENLASTEAGVVKGKFGYMSPEQVRGAVLDRRSDVFSAGICLYELLTGQRLFSGESDYNALERVRNVSIEPPSRFNRQIPSSLERVVLQALAKSLRDRYQTTNDLRRALQAFLADARLVIQREDLGTYMRALFAEEFAASEALPDAVQARSGGAITGDSSDTPTDGFDLESEKTLVARPRDLMPPGSTYTGSGDDAATGLYIAHHDADEAARASELDSELESETQGPSPLQMVWNDYDQPRSAPPQAEGSRAQSRLAHSAVFEMDPGASTEPVRRGVVGDMAALPTLELRKSDANFANLSKLAVAVAAGLTALALILYFGFGQAVSELRIQTEPRDATVYVDGRRIVGSGAGQGSPFRATKLPTKSTHTVVVESPGFVSWSTTLRLPADRPFDLPLVRLEPTTKPTELGPSEHELPSSEARESAATEPGRARASGDFSSERARAAESAERVLSSKPSSDAAPVAAASAEVRAATRPSAPSPAKSGTHAGTKPAAKSAPESPLLGAKLETESRAPAKAASDSQAPSRAHANTGPSGTLRINTRPWSQVSVDGVVVGNTPQTNLQLKPGKHTILLSNPKFGVSQTLVLTIKPNEVVTRVLTLTP